jgi:hypothetical protein
MSTSDPAMAERVIVLTTGPRVPAPIWPVVVTAALLLVTAAALAWWRARPRTSSGSRRRVRIFAASIAGGGSAAAMRFVSAATDPNRFAWGLDGLSDDLILFAGLFGYTLLAAMLVGTGDLLFDALRPSRTRFWLLAGVPFFAAFIVGTLYVTGSVEPFASRPTIAQETLLVAALAASLIWWSWLPRPDDGMAEIFE